MDAPVRRAKLKAEARQLAAAVDRLHVAVYLFDRDHLDKYERDALDRALASLCEAGRALDSLASSLGRPAGRR
jgi:hypothetical protein